MPKSSLHISETERMARVITKCYSQATLEIAAKELSVETTPKNDIFRALVVSGIATDFDDAVLIVARHLDQGMHANNGCDDLVDGRVERRKVPRKSL